MTAKKNHQHCSRTPAARHSERGYVLIVFVLFSALLLVGLAAIMRKASFEGQREREEELVFRGMQYYHAIQLYFRKYGRYPNSLDDLVKTGGVRFLRKRYKDPMTKEGTWRLIHVGPGGAFVDALTNPLRIPTAGGSSTPGSAPAANPTGNSTGTPAQPGGTGLGSSSSQGSSPGGLFPSSSGQGSSSQSGIGSLGAPGGFGGSATGGGQPGVAPTSPSANPGANPSLQPGASAQGQQLPDGTASGGQPSSSSSLQQPTTFVGPIAGVASTSKNDAIRIFNANTVYNKWEFIFDYSQDPVAVAALARITGGTQTGGTQAQPQVPAGGAPPPSTAQQQTAFPQNPTSMPAPAPQIPAPTPGGFPTPAQ